MPDYKIERTSVGTSVINLLSDKGQPNDINSGLRHLDLAADFYCPPVLNNPQTPKTPDRDELNVWSTN